MAADVGGVVGFFTEVVKLTRLVAGQLLLAIIVAENLALIA
jgi:hypothetical protein